MKYFLPAIIVLIIVALLLMFLQKSPLQSIQCPMAKKQAMAKNEDIKGLEI